MDLLISTDELADRLGEDSLVILDATMFLPEAGRDAPAEFTAGHIPGARFLDLASLRDTASPLPSMLPPAALVAERFGRLGVRPDSRIVLYDDAPHRTAARAWFILDSHGLGNVRLLDGGLAKWRREGRPLETGAPDARPAEDALPGIVADDRRVRDLASVKAGLDSRTEQLVDARSAARFAGEEAESRPGVVPGHIPGSRNLPYDRLFTADGRWKRGDALKAAFTDAGVDLDRPLVTTCGSGITASVLLLGAALLGKTDTALYDGSWSEWGADPSAPKALGPA